MADSTRPETAIFAQFDGLRNTVEKERLKPTELERAQNVDLDDVGQLRLRRGYRVFGTWTSPCHSLFSSDTGRVFVAVSDNGWKLREVRTGGVGSSLTYATVGPSPISYVQVQDTIYYSSADAHGTINIAASEPLFGNWGRTSGQGRWLSPVVNPTAGLAAIRGELLGDPPKATALTYWNGRIYLADERMVWATKLHLYHYVDRTKGFYQFESPVTVIGAVTDGVYVGTETDIFFLTGSHAQGLRRIPLANYGALRGSLLTMPAELLKPQLAPQEHPSRNAVVFMSDAGVVAGFDNGELYNLTQAEVLFPKAQSVAALFRQQDGVNQFLAVADSGGTPTSSTRIGDYVEAEIRRFNGA